jgi:putative PEP-CTERM system TPR-repeat lipoprotein
MNPLNRVGRTVALLAVLMPIAACSKDPEAAKRDYLERGNHFVEQKKLPEAVIEYRNAINVDARFGEARFKLAETYERLGDAQNAFNEFVRAADLLPDREDVQLKVGQYLLVAREFGRAKGIAENLLQKNIKSVPAQVLLANALAGLKDFPAAITELETAVQLDPQRVDTYLNLAVYQAVSGNPAEAEAVLRNALSMAPRSVDARLGLANLAWASGDLVKAEAILKDALALEPKHEMANRALATLYLRSGRAAAAEASIRAVAESSESTTGRFTLAQYYLSTNRVTEAIPILDALAKDPKGRVPAAMLLARVDYAGARREQAHKRLDQLLTQEPANAQILLLKAQFLGADGKIDEAIARAQAAATAAPRLAAAQHMIGLLYLQKKDPEQALNAFNEALKLDPASADVSLQVAKLQLASGRANLALQSAEDVVRKQPDNMDARLTLVRALVAGGNAARAETEVSKLAAQAPRSADVQVLVGTVAAMKKNIPAARAAFTRAQELDSASTAALAGLLALDLSSGKPAAARARIAARLAADPSNPALLELAGRAYMSLGDAAKAEQAWRTLVEVEPASMVAYGALGQLFLSQGRLEDARREFERYAEREPKAVGAHTLVGIILQMQNRLPEAQKKYERTLEINPNAAVAANNLAWLYAEQNANLDTALQLAQTAKSQLPESHEVDDTLGWVYYKKGLATLAISAFERSVAKDPTKAEYLYHLGLAHLKNGDKVKARESLEKALKAKGDFPDAADAKKILSGLG